MWGGVAWLRASSHSDHAVILWLRLSLSLLIRLSRGHTNRRLVVGLWLLISIRVFGGWMHTCVCVSQRDTLPAGQAPWRWCGNVEPPLPQAGQLDSPPVSAPCLPHTLAGPPALSAVVVGVQFASMHSGHMPTSNPPTGLSRFSAFFIWTKPPPHQRPPKPRVPCRA